MQELARFAPYNTPYNISDLPHVTAAAQGEYNTNYDMRAFMANVGYLALTAVEQLYQMYAGDGGTLELAADETYVFTFSGKSPIMEKGFWSLTGYNAQKYLIKNYLGKYSVSDRSGLTYGESMTVYGEGAEEDSEFQVLVKPVDMKPPYNWTSK